MTYGSVSSNAYFPLNPKIKAQIVDDRVSVKSGRDIVQDGFRILKEQGIAGIRASMAKHPKSARKAFYAMSGGKEVIKPTKETYRRLQDMGFTQCEINLLRELFSPYDNDVTLESFMIVA